MADKGQAAGLVPPAYSLSLQPSETNAFKGTPETAKRHATYMAPCMLQENTLCKATQLQLMATHQKNEAYKKVVGYDNGQQIPSQKGN